MHISEWLELSKPINRIVEIERDSKKLSEQYPLSQHVVESLAKLIILAVKNYTDGLSYSFIKSKETSLFEQNLYSFTYENKPFILWMSAKNVATVGATIEIQ